MSYITFLFHIALVVPMTNVLVAMARVFGGNFGIAIIVFTLAMKFVTWPLTSSQYKASRAMQSIQPQMQELQKKYKGKDPKKLQAETMALYREAGVNPLGCILPMIAQFPIWIALYEVIRSSLGSAPESLVTLSQNLYPFSFVHTAVPLNTHLLFWDLGTPDTSYMLPLLVGLTMYVQQKLMTPPVTGTGQQAQQQQQTQQMMTWMMPLMFGFMSTTVPAGLALYWFMSNLSGVVLQYFYMGRKLEWRTLFTLSPAAAPAPTARARDRRPADEGRGKQARQAADSAPAADAESEDEREAPGDSSTGQAARRKRHGRRRGKR
ncbi:MAG TPA: YidC/Oxa1 family membrane protein insertase [Dehalococcoidia bacterium]|nr:YidC/Oxa1 family membrane protein insertase [Dehalococcoidia bacterium]